jgi:spore coat polysaccharide biosynthesis predicted glycosyltransferase SpsG
MTDNTSSWLDNIHHDINQITSGLHDLNISFIDLLVIDHYAIDYRWESWFLGQFPDIDKIMVIDDLANREHICDYLVDTTYLPGQSYDNNDISYDDKYYDNRYHNNQLISRDAMRMLGSKYVMLNSEFSYYRHDGENNHMIILPDETLRISIAFGGADIPNATGQVVQVLLQEYRSMNLNNIKVDIILGGLNQHKDEIQSLIRDVPIFQLYQNLSYKDLLNLLSMSHLNVGAGGISLYERCCLGIPSVVITLAENQVGNAVNMEKDNIITYLGDMNSWTHEDLIVAINKYRLDAKYYQEARDRCQDIVDDNGCQRILENLDLNRIE